MVASGSEDARRWSIRLLVLAKLRFQVGPMRQGSGFREETAVQDPVVLVGGLDGDDDGEDDEGEDNDEDVDDEDVGDEDVDDEDVDDENIDDEDVDGEDEGVAVGNEKGTIMAMGFACVQPVRV
jgi:hypothetical protein